MSTSPAAAVPAATVPLWWKWLLVLPALVHAALMGWSLWGGETPQAAEFSRVDLAVHLAVFGLLGLLLFVFDSRRATFWLLVVTYLTLIGVIGSELVARWMLPPPPPLMPRLPMQVSDTVGPGFGSMSDTTYDFSVNSLGLRGPEVDFHAADVSILCLGGGTTECMYVTDKDSWPWALQDKLAADLGVSVFVGNGGVRDFCTINIERILREYKDGPIPQFDWVVVLCGFNDWGNKLTVAEVKVLEHLEEMPFPPTFVYPEQNPLYYRNTGLLRLLKRNATDVGDTVGYWLPEERKLRARLLEKRQVHAGEHEDLPNLLRVYQNNLKAIHTACRDRGYKLLFLTQPTLYLENLPAHYQKLLWRTDKVLKQAPTLDYLEKMNRQYNEVMVDYCKRAGVEYIDLMELIQKDPSLLYDDCHLNVNGCKKVSERVTSVLREKLK